MPSKEKERIVIIGGGFAGVRCALDVSRHVYKDAEIILIDKGGYHQFHPLFYKIATTFLPESRLARPETFSDLRDEICIPLAEIIDTQKITLIKGDVVSIDAFKNTITLSSGERLFYHWLVCAVGSVNNYFDIEGAETYGFSLKSAKDALRIRNKIDEVFSSTPKHQTVRIVIGGGGFTGSELAAALACFTKQLARVHAHPKDNIRITVIEAGNTLLHGASAWSQAKTKKRLERLGVEVLLRSRITKVTATEIQGDAVLDQEEHPLRRIHSHDRVEPFTLRHNVFIWTAGVKAHPLADHMEGVRKDKNRCLIVDEYLRALPFSNIFAVGDISFCESFDEPLPMTAHVAISQGRYVAYMLKRILHKKMMFRYHKKNAYFVIPLGETYALADFGWLRLSGKLGWWLKSFIAFDYFTGILPLRKAWRRWRIRHKG